MNTENGAFHTDGHPGCNAAQKQILKIFYTAFDKALDSGNWGTQPREERNCENKKI